MCISLRYISLNTKRRFFSPNVLCTELIFDFSRIFSTKTELLKNELERIEKDGQLPKFDMTRYELPEPTIGKQKDVASWQRCLENSYAQLEQQNFRVLNLKLLDSYGTEAWKAYNEVLDHLIKYNKQKLIDTKRRIQQTNYERKSSQEKAGEKLKHLEANWVSLVSKNFEIEQACLNLENEIQMLEKYHKFSRPGESEDEPRAKRQRTDNGEENANEDDPEDDE